MTMLTNPTSLWRRRHLLASVAGLAVSAGLGACATEQSAIGATSNARGRDLQDDAPSASPGLLAYRTGRNFGDTAAPVGSTFSIFQAFAPGAVPSGSIVRIAVGGMPAAAQQCDNRVAWPDGSLRGGVFTWTHPHPIPSGGRSQITLHAEPGRWDETPAAALRDVLAHDYQLRVVIGGSTYALRANNAIAAGRVARIRGGPACAAWKVWGDLRGGSGPGAAPQGQMWAKMFIYVTRDGQVRIEDEIYCTKIADSTALPVGGYALLDGTRVLSRQTRSFVLRTRNKFATYDKDGAEYFSAPQLSKVVWAFPRPVHGRPATTGLYDALITWWNEWSPAYIAAFRTPRPVPYVPAGFLAEIFPDGVDGTGNHRWLGPMTSTAVMAMLSGQYDHFRGDRIMALGSWSVCGYWCADDVTGLPPVFTDKHYRGLSKPITKVGWGLAPTLRMSGGANPATTLDASHAGLWWWWQYLATGSEQALENVQEQAVGVLGCDVGGDGLYQRNPKFANGKQYFGSYCDFPQARAVGWAFRNFSNAYWVTPDAHPLKPYLDDLVRVQYDSTEELLKQMAPSWGSLAWWMEGGNSAEYARSTAPWMGDYRVTSVLMDYRRGRIRRDHLAMVHVIKHQYGRMVDGNFFNGAGAYVLMGGVGPNPPRDASVPRSWTEVYGFQNPPHATHPLIDHPPIRSGLRNQSIIEGPAQALPLGHAFVGHTYPNIALCAGSCGVIVGLGTYPDKVVGYLRPIIDRAGEELWGSTPGAQAWRIRPPA